jgi:hypothetical protein
MIHKSPPCPALKPLVEIFVLHARTVPQLRVLLDRHPQLCHLHCIILHCQLFFKKDRKKTKKEKKESPEVALSLTKTNYPSSDDSLLTNPPSTCAKNRATAYFVRRR